MKQISIQEADECIRHSWPNDIGREAARHCSGLSCRQGRSACSTPTACEVPEIDPPRKATTPTDLLALVLIACASLGIVIALGMWAWRAVAALIGSPL